MGELLLQYTEMSQFQEFHWWYSGTANVRERGRSCGELTVCSFQFEWQSGVASKKMTFVWISFSHNMCGRKTK